MFNPYSLFKKNIMEVVVFNMYIYIGVFSFDWIDHVELVYIVWLHAIIRRQT